MYEVIKRCGTYIYNGEYYSATRKNEMMPFASTWMNIETIIRRDVSQTEKGKYHMISLICEIKKDANTLIYKTEKDWQTLKPNVLLSINLIEEWREGINLQFWINMHTTISKIDNQQGHIV